MTRSVTCRYAWVLLAALTFVAVGCGGGTDVVEDAGGGAAGAPFDEEGDDVAVGAPITIPDFQIVGADFEQQRQFVEDEFRRVCGGELCVTVVAVPDDEPGGEPCEITAVPSGTVERGSTVAFEVSEPCGASTEEGDDPPPDDESEPPSEAPDEPDEPATAESDAG